MRTEVTCVARVSTGLNYYTAVEQLELTNSSDDEKQGKKGEEKREERRKAWCR